MTDNVKQIIQVLRCDTKRPYHCHNCDAKKFCMGKTVGDVCKVAADLIEQMVKENDRLTEALKGAMELCKQAEGLKRERDAAIKDITRSCGTCKHFVVLHNGCTPDYDCELCGVNRNVSGINTTWEWRGVCAENGGVDRVTDAKCLRLAQTMRLNCPDDEDGRGAVLEGE